MKKNINKKAIITSPLSGTLATITGLHIQFQGEGEEYIPLREYLLRHDKAIFWVIESMIPFGNHPLFLFFLGWMLPPKPAFMKLTTTPVGKYHPEDLSFSSLHS
jgi:hypothetical protein